MSTADIAYQVSFVLNDKLPYLPHEKQLIHYTHREFELVEDCLHKLPSGKQTILRLVILLKEVVEIFSDIHCKSLSTCLSAHHEAL
jgi:hypothetical protein